MGWAYGINASGREVGYSVPAKCDAKGCDENIDRGLAYVCGGMHDGGEHGCGDYFCSSHLYLTENKHSVSAKHFMCEQCCDLFEEGDEYE